MGKIYVKNKDLGIRRAPSSFILFNKKVMGEGCEASIATEKTQKQNIRQGKAYGKMANDA